MWEGKPSDWEEVLWICFHGNDSERKQVMFKPGSAVFSLRSRRDLSKTSMKFSVTYHTACVNYADVKSWFSEAMCGLVTFPGSLNQQMTYTGGKCSILI